MMLRIGSICSGIGGGELAFAGLAEHVFASEIDRFARAVLAHRFPEVPLHGDFTTIEAGSYGPVDVLVGGTPCQSFSIAGLRGGMADARGNLALQYLRLADRLRPRWLVWENVPGVLSSGGGRDFGAFLGGLAKLGYGWAYRILDAQYFALAQRRSRVFVVGCLGDWRGAAAVLFEPASLRWDPAPSREAREAIARPIAGGAEGGSGYRNDADTADNVATARNAHGGPHGRLDFASETFAVHSRQTPITADNCALPIETNGQSTAVVQGFGVRRLTSMECERLQGFPDDWTAIEYRGKPAADGPRYRALGNAFPVPVIRWIARRIARESFSDSWTREHPAAAVGAFGAVGRLWDTDGQRKPIVQSLEDPKLSPRRAWTAGEAGMHQNGTAKLGTR